MPVPPSLTVAEPVRLTVVTSMVSVTLVTAAAGLMARLSKLPPLAPVMVALTLPASMWFIVVGGAATLTVPVVAPAPMVISGRWRGHGDRGLCGVGERGGVNDAAAFGDARRRRQADRGDVGDGFVRDGGADGGAAGNQVFRSCRR